MGITVTSLLSISLAVLAFNTKVHAYNGCEHTLVVLDDGQMVSFGYNYRGQLGHGDTSSEPVPKPVRGLDGIRVTQVSCSYYHSIISCDNGEVNGIWMKWWYFGRVESTTSWLTSW